MSHQDEDDDFFADIYGGDDQKTKASSASTAGVAGGSSDSSKPAETSASSTPAAAPAPASAPASASASSASSDPRLALLAGGDAAESTPAAPAVASASEPSSATAATSDSAVPAALPGLPQGMPDMTTGGAFDPAAFAKQLEQMQQFQQAVQDGIRKDAPQGGFHAGNIFIPAKDEGKMFIGGLNWETTDESMKSYFSQFGEVTECTVMRDSVTGRSRGFGFLTFKDAPVVNIVLSKEHFLDGKIIDPKRAIPREEQDKTAKIFVGGVGGDVTEEDFKDFFEQYGTVIDAQLMIDKDTGRPRGFGFVTFDSPQAVETIVSQQFLTLKGKSIEVKRAEPRAREQRQVPQQAPQQMGYGAMPGMGSMGAMAGMQGMPNMAAMPNMNPAMMQQYYQQWQAYMSQMQDMMRQGQSTAGMPGMPNMSGMPGMPGAPGGSASGSGNGSDSRSGTGDAGYNSPDHHPQHEGGRDFRRDRDRRGNNMGNNNDRRRSRSPSSRDRNDRNDRSDRSRSDRGDRNGDRRRRPMDRDRDQRDRHYNRG